MEKVELWKATDGTLHSTRVSAVKASLIALINDISEQAAIELDDYTVGLVVDFMAHSPERFVILLAMPLTSVE